MPARPLPEALRAGSGAEANRTYPSKNVSVPLARYLYPSGTGECVSVTSTAGAKGTPHTALKL